MQNQSTKSRLFSPTSAALSPGFTLIELLVATLIASIILGLSLGLVNQQRRQVLGSQSQTQVKQNLRAAMDLIGTDAKLAGERLELPSDYFELPVISLVDGGGANNPDTLTLQRKLLPDVLTVCDDLNIGDGTITVSNVPGAGSCVFTDADGNNLTDTLDAFQDYRCSQDGANACARVLPLAGGADCDDECTVAFIHDPQTDQGEFFTYTFEEADDPTNPTLNRIHARPLNPTGDWLIPSYPAANAPVIYILEERQFSLNGGLLQLSLNRQPPINLVNQLENFQVQLMVDQDNDSTTAAVSRDSFNTVQPPAEVWQRVERIQVMLQACDPALPACDAFGSDQVDVPLARRQLTSDFFPRNAISRPGA